MSIASQLALNNKHSSLTAQVAGMRCARCKAFPAVAWIQCDWAIKCQCPIGEHVLEKPNYVEDRRVEIIKPMKPVANPKEDLW